MGCEQVERALVGFHFGVVAPDVRAKIEAHLVGCRGCLESFLALKREIEASAESDATPSAGARARLRRAVARELAERAPGPAASGARRWETPLAFAFAGAAVIGALVMTGALATTAGAPPRGSHLEPPSSVR